MMDAAIPIILRKIERRQNRAGTWPDETDYAKDIPQGRREIQTHCIAVNALNDAVRYGFPVNPQTIQRAEQYFLKHHDVLDASIRVSTLYNMYRARCDSLRAAQLELASGRVVAPSRLQTLQKDLLECRTLLAQDIAVLLRPHGMKAHGPRLADMDDLLAAVQEIAPEKFPAFAKSLRDAILPRQRLDGHFIAGFLNDDSVVNRGENTFGTATSLIMLMHLENHLPKPKP